MSKFRKLLSMFEQNSRRRRESMERIRERRTSNLEQLKDGIHDTKSMISTLHKFHNSKMSAFERNDKFRSTSGSYGERKTTVVTSGTQYRSWKSTRKSSRIRKSQTASNSNYGFRNSSVQSSQKPTRRTRREKEEDGRKSMIMLAQNSGLDYSFDVKYMKPKEFSDTIESTLEKNDINDYSDFDYVQKSDQNYGFSKYYPRHYQTEEVAALMKIQVAKTFECGEVIKPQNKALKRVFVIVTGKLGVFEYPKGKEKLLKVLKSKEVVGDDDINFTAVQNS